MQKAKLMVLAVAVCLGFESAQAGIPISITKFTNKAGSSNCRYGWDWWERNLGSGFKEMLADELLKSDQIELFERETISEMYNSEHELVNSQEDTSIKRGKFKKAKYTFVGAVTEFEYCASEKKGSVNVGAIAGLFGVPAPDIDVGMKGASAKIAIDLRVIETETGRILKSVRAEGSVNDQKFALDTRFGDFSSQENSPMGQAAREAISKAAKQALTVIR